MRVRETYLVGLEISQQCLKPPGIACKRPYERDSQDTSSYFRPNWYLADHQRRKHAATFALSHGMRDDYIKSLGRVRVCHKMKDSHVKNQVKNREMLHSSSARGNPAKYHFVLKIRLTKNEAASSDHTREHVLRKSPLGSPFLQVVMVSCISVHQFHCSQLQFQFLNSDKTKS